MYLQIEDKRTVSWEAIPFTGKEKVWSPKARKWDDFKDAARPCHIRDILVGNHGWKRFNHHFKGLVNPISSRLLTPSWWLKAQNFLRLKKCSCAILVDECYYEFMDPKTSVASPSGHKMSVWLVASQKTNCHMIGCHRLNPFTGVLNPISFVVSLVFCQKLGFYLSSAAVHLRLRNEVENYPNLFVTWRNLSPGWWVCSWILGIS